MTLRALVADDDAPVRQMVRDLLAERGVEVVLARDGLEALNLFRDQVFDLLVTDFLMPRVDGMQVVRSVRLAGERGRLPIVLMSAISKGHIPGEHEPGPDHYINKPFKLRKMAKLLDRVLAGLDS